MSCLGGDGGHTPPGKNTHTKGKGSFEVINLKLPRGCFSHNHYVKRSKAKSSKKGSSLKLSSGFGCFGLMSS